MERLRVLLVNPPQLLYLTDTPTTSLPLDLAYLGGVLEKQFDVKILDCMVEGFSNKQYVTPKINRWGVDMDEIALRIARWEPDVVGILCHHPTQEEVVSDVASVYKKHAKIRKKNIITVVFGYHATASPWDIMNSQEIDFVVLGEPEIPLFELCRSLYVGMDVSEIEGIAYRDYLDRVLVNPRSTYVDDMDQMPKPARHLFLMDKYFTAPCFYLPHANPFTNITFSRGCDAQCIFCPIPNYYGRKFRRRSVDNAMQEIKELIEKYEVMEIYIDDRNFLRDLDFAEELFERIAKAHLNVNWAFPRGLTVWRYSRKLVDLLKEAGCYTVTLDILSGNDRVLNEVIKSPQDLDTIVNFVMDLKRKEIGVHGRFTVGYPSETEEEILDTYRFIRDLELTSYKVDIAMPVPGTSFWKICQQEGLFVRPVNYRDYIVESGLIRTEHFDPDRLLEIMEKGEKLVWRRRASKDPKVLMESIGAFIDSNILHPFTSKEKKRR